MANFKEQFTLTNGTKMPAVGFGTWQTPAGDVAYNSVLAALKAGYRHIDTAAYYGNEESVGQAIKDSGIPREDIFVTTKLWNDAHGYEQTKMAFGESLERLGLSYVDLYLIHWPNPKQNRNDWQKANAGSWKAMEEFYEEGSIKAIGVSNFQAKHIDALLETAKIAPMVNQIFVNPSDPEPGIVEFDDNHDILTEAYSPLGTGALLKLQPVIDMANKYSKTPAQVLLRWSFQNGYVPLPKSTHDEYIQSNLDIFDFTLSEADMQSLNGLQGQGGTHIDPDTTNF